MRFVMIREYVTSSISVAERTVHLALQMELRFEPKRQCLHPRPETLRRERHIGRYQAVEFGQWLVIEPYIVEVRRRNASFVQAILDRVNRKTMVMLDTGESLLLCRRYDPTVDDQGRGRVVV